MATYHHLSPIIVIAIIAIVLIARLQNASKRTLKFKQYTSGPEHLRYVPQFNPQMELDIRLPYKRFKQLYPSSDIAYEEYKKNANTISIQTLPKLTTKQKNGAIKTNNKPLFL